MPIDMAPPPRTARKATTPRKATPSQVPEKTASDVSPLFGPRCKGLAGLAQVGQMACMAFGYKADAAAIGMHSGPLITELARLADSQPAVARFIDPLIVAGPYAALLAATVPLVVQIAANHKMGTMMNLGAVPPEVLEARMDAEMMRMEMSAMLERKQMMEEAEAARREMAEMMEQTQKVMANA